MMLNKNEPITRREAELLELLISAIKQRKAARMYYQRYWKKIVPYLIGLNKNGKGDLFMIGDDGSANSRPIPYLLKNINPKSLSIVEGVLTRLNVNEKWIYEPSPKIRVVYRTVLRQ